PPGSHVPLFGSHGGSGGGQQPGVGSFVPPGVVPPPLHPHCAGSFTQGSLHELGSFGSTHGGGGAGQSGVVVGSQGGGGHLPSGTVFGSHTGHSRPFSPHGGGGHTTPLLGS